VRERVGDHDGERLADVPGTSTEPAANCAGRSRSSAVNTAATPGIARASSTPSMAFTVACAKMERTNTARSAPGTSTFSRYLPSPRRNRGSSVRRAGTPKVDGGIVVTRAIVP
jgi:hypothetical protein